MTSISSTIYKIILVIKMLEFFSCERISQISKEERHLLTIDSSTTCNIIITKELLGDSLDGGVDGFIFISSVLLFFQRQWLDCDHRRRGGTMICSVNSSDREITPFWILWNMTSSRWTILFYSSSTFPWTYFIVTKDKILDSKIGNKVDTTQLAIESEGNIYNKSNKNEISLVRITFHSFLLTAINKARDLFMDRLIGST